jgi:hypothetical protein
VSLAARHLEANGIPTVICGSARDIVEQTAVPRFLFTDFPLGNPMGKPYNVDMQQAITAMAVDLLESAAYPRTTVQAPFSWGDDTWRARYMRVDDSNRDALREAGEQRREQQARAKAEGRVRSA